MATVAPAPSGEQVPARDTRLEKYRAMRSTLDLSTHGSSEQRKEESSRIRESLKEELELANSLLLKGK